MLYQAQVPGTRTPLSAPRTLVLGDQARRRVLGLGVDLGPASGQIHELASEIQRRRCAGGGNHEIILLMLQVNPHLTVSGETREIYDKELT